MVGLSTVLEEDEEEEAHHHHQQHQHRRQHSTTTKVVSKTRNMSMVINNNPNTCSSSSSSSTPKTTPSSSSSSSALWPGFPAADFLDQCFLCRTKLSPGKDIYMYRGDRAFCSEECRCRQILLDEEEALGGENHNHCSIGGRTGPHPSSSSSSSSSSCSRNRRGSRNGAPGGV